MKMPDYMETALDFYEFDYFGSKLVKDNSEELVKICARRAYIDLCRTLTYNKNIDKKYHDLFCEGISKYIFSKIEEYKLLESQEDTIFDDRHCTICKSIMTMAGSAETENGEKILITKSKNEDAKTFYYGHAQKWLNMTLKYMWMSGALKDKGDVEKNLHIPVDRYIIKAVLNEKDVFLPLKTDKRKRTVDNVISWSKWSKDDYEQFQNSVRPLYKGKKLPLVWENKEWIKFAQKNNEEESKKKNNDFDEWMKRSGNWNEKEKTLFSPNR